MVSMHNDSQESYHLLIYGEMNHSPLWGKVIVNINHLLLTISSAVNIIIYSYKVKTAKRMEQVVSQSQQYFLS